MLSFPSSREGQRYDVRIGSVMACTLGIVNTSAPVVLDRWHRVSLDFTSDGMMSRKSCQNEQKGKSCKCNIAPLNHRYISRGAPSP